MGKEAATPGGNVASAAAALQTHLEGSDAPDAARNQRWGTPPVNSKDPFQLPVEFLRSLLKSLWLL